MVAIRCLECGYEWPLDAPLVEGQTMFCPRCRARFEVIRLDPLELDWAYYEPSYPWEELEGYGLEA
ncbi:MAG: hypothetical protein JXA37_05560 [Chloroflexia bacterium]|nr:hypothetical protein [Chloroflexia bacterium]